MRASLGKTCKESASSVTLFLATSLALVTLAVTPAAAATLHPAARLVASPPSLHLVTLGHGAGERPDGRLAPALAAASLLPATVTVVTGDTLSGLAQAHLGSAARWTDLWNANRSLVGDPNLIQPGWALALPAGHVDPPAGTVSVVVAPVHGRTQLPATRRALSSPGTSATRVNPGNYAGFQACVIRRESGGNPQVMNATRHYGLYQFSFSTWVANGGSPTAFGHASVAEQNAVFATAMSKPGGRNNWAPYDGC